jgi:hypothetical protein
MASNIDMTTNILSGTVSDKRWTPTDVVSPVPAALFNATKDIPTMDAYLVATDGTYWTATRLLQESVWDKLYWARVKQLGSTELT